MPRSIQISKEKILNAALEILIRDGYSAVNIKSVAKELNCSTQPISWHFGNIEKMRDALIQAAVAYANRKMMSDSQNCMDKFRQVGYAYINMAFDEPNLFRFVYMGESKQYCRGGIDSILTDKGNVILIDELAQYFNISKQQAGTFVQRMIIFTHGIAALIVAGVLNCTKEQVYSMVNDFGIDLLSLAGTDLDVQSIMTNAADCREKKFDA